MLATPWLRPRSGSSHWSAAPGKLPLLGGRILRLRCWRAVWSVLPGPERSVPDECFQAVMLSLLRRRCLRSRHGCRHGFWRFQLRYVVLRCRARVVLYTERPFLLLCAGTEGERDDECRDFWKCTVHVHRFLFLVGLETRLVRYSEDRSAPVLRNQVAHINSAAISRDSSVNSDLPARHSLKGKSANRGAP